MQGSASPARRRAGRTTRDDRLHVHRRRAPDRCNARAGADSLEGPPGDQSTGGVGPREHIGDAHRWLPSAPSERSLGVEGTLPVNVVGRQVLIRLEAVPTHLLALGRAPSAGERLGIEGGARGHQAAAPSLPSCGALARVWSRIESVWVRGSGHVAVDRSGRRARCTPRGRCATAGRERPAPPAAGAHSQRHACPARSRPASSTAAGPVYAGSPAAAKVAFFADLFADRPDVYALRWENARTGRAGGCRRCAAAGVRAFRTPSGVTWRADRRGDHRPVVRRDGAWPVPVPGRRPLLLVGRRRGRPHRDAGRPCPPEGRPRSRRWRSPAPASARTSGCSSPHPSRRLVRVYCDITGETGHSSEAPTLGV